MSAWEALLPWRDEAVEWSVKLRKLEATGCFSPANKPMACVPTNGQHYGIRQRKHDHGHRDWPDSTDMAGTASKRVIRIVAR